MHDNHSERETALDLVVDALAALKQSNVAMNLARANSKLASFWHRAEAICARSSTLDADPVLSSLAQEFLTQLHRRPRDPQRQKLLSELNQSLREHLKRIGKTVEPPYLISDESAREALAGDANGGAA